MTLVMAMIPISCNMLTKVWPIPVSGINIRLILPVSVSDRYWESIGPDTGFARRRLLVHCWLTFHCVTCQSVVSRIKLCMVSLIPPSGSTACPVGATSGTTTDWLWYRCKSAVSDRDLLALKSKIAAMWSCPLHGRYNKSELHHAPWPACGFLWNQAS